MDIELIFTLFYAFLTGAGVGLVSSILGLGGGIVMVPLLPLLADITPRETIGTSLMTVFLVTSVNVWRFHLVRQVTWSVGLLGGAFSALGSFIAAVSTGWVHPFVLHSGMAMAVGLVALMTFVPRVADCLNLPRETDAQKRVSSGWIGLASGLIGGFTGVGGGVLVTPLLARLQLVATRSVVPTANVTIMFTALAGTLALVNTSHGARAAGGHFTFGLVRLDLAIALFLGAQLTSPYGRRVQSDLDARKRDWLIGALLVALALRTSLAAWNSLPG